MITQLAIAGYRSLRNVTVRLSQLNIVTGANGSGKSNLYRALRLLADSARNGAVAALAREGGLASTLWAGSPGTGRTARQGRPMLQGARIVQARCAGGVLGLLVARAGDPPRLHLFHLSDRRHLGEHGAIDCAVLWVKNGRTGLAFTEETRLECYEGEQAAILREVITRHFPGARFDPPKAAEDEASEQRQERRHPLIWLGTLHYDYESTPARLRLLTFVARNTSPRRVRMTSPSLGSLP